MNRKQIGNCGVDAGCLIIIDPCYIKHIPDLHTDDRWLEFCKVIEATAHTRERGGQIHDGGGGVIVSTGGDGSFPVYAHYDEDGRITKVEVVFEGSPPSP